MTKGKRTPAKCLDHEGNRKTEKDTIMLAVAEKKLFRPNAVHIPVDGKEGRDFDRADCTLLFVDGEYSHAEVYTEEAWQHDGEPSYVQQRGDFFLPDGSDIPEGKAQLLPDTCVVKLPERDYWSDDVQSMTKRIFGVYVFDRRQHHHLCEFCASYELWFLETQYEDTDEVSEDEDRRDELYQIVQRADCRTEPVSYMHRKDIDPLLLRGRRVRPGWLPTNERGGGYRVRGIRSVTWDGVIDEINEWRCNGTL